MYDVKRHRKAKAKIWIQEAFFRAYSLSNPAFCLYPHWIHPQDIPAQRTEKKAQMYPMYPLAAKPLLKRAFSRSVFRERETVEKLKKRLI
jgi:hypothetical protein